MRLVTRADLDGLACAVLLTSCEAIDSIEREVPAATADDTVAAIVASLKRNG